MLEIDFHFRQNTPKNHKFYIFTNEQLKRILILFEFKNRSKGSSLVKKLLTY